MFSFLPLLVLFFSVLFTSFLSGIFGMIGGTIMLAVLLQLYVPATALALHGIAQVTSNGWRVFLWRKYIYTPVLPGYFFGALVSVILFTLLQIQFDLLYIYLFLGFLPFSTLILPQGKGLDITKRGISFVCGFSVISLQLMAGVAGGFLDQSFINSHLERRQQIATKAVIQVVAHLTKTLYFTVLLQQTNDWHDITWVMAVLLIFGAMLGNSLAAKPVQRMKQENFKKYSTYLLYCLGIFFFYKAGSLFYQTYLSANTL